MQEFHLQQYQFAQYVIRNCKRTCAAEEVFRKVADRIYSQIDYLCATLLQQEKASTACASGCYYCCYLKVDTHPHEVFRIVEYLESEYSSEEVKDILSCANNNRKRIASMGLKQHLRANLACCLLHNNRCMAYPVRPASCRVYHAQRVKTCKDSFDFPDRLDLLGSWVQGVRLSLDIANGAIVKALQDAGYDSRACDLNSALFEALFDRGIKTRWLNGGSAFSGSALVKK